MVLVLQLQVSRFCECKAIVSATYEGLGRNSNDQIGEKCTYDINYEHVG